MRFLFTKRGLASSLALMLTVLVVSSCSGTTEVRSDVSEAAVANLSPDQQAWHYLTMGESGKLNDLLKSNPDLVYIYDETTYNTLLHSAALRGDWDCLKVLIENGADLYAENENGEIAAETALREAHVDISKYLRELGSGSAAQ